MIPKPSVAWGASQVLSIVPAILYGVACTIGSPGSYYVIVLDATSAPADASDVTHGAFGAYLWCMPVTTTIADQTVDLDFGDDATVATQSGLRGLKGIVVELSSDLPTNITGVTNGLWCNGRIG